MKVLVTGGAGYIGAELVFHLSKREDVQEVVVYDNMSSRNFNLFISHRNAMKGASVSFVQGDLLDTRTLNKAMKGVDVVYHLAAKVTNPYQGADSDMFEQVNHWATAEVCYAAEDAGVKRFYSVSSAGVYGFSTNGDDVNEESRLNPRTFYSISKMRGEGHVLRLQDKMDAIVFRSANVYGYSPTIRFESVINKFLFEAHFNGKISIHGSGKQVRPFIHLQNLIASLLEPLNQKVENGVYNLVQHNTSILDLVDLYKELYPELEFIFINQHLELRDLRLELSGRYSKYLDFGTTELKSEIDSARDELAF